MSVSIGLCSSRAFRIVDRADDRARASMVLGIVHQILESPYLRMGGFLRTFHIEDGELKVSSATLPLEYLGFFVAMSWMPMMFSLSQVVISASGVSLGKPPSRRVWPSSSGARRGPSEPGAGGGVAVIGEVGAARARGVWKAGRRTLLAVLASLIGREDWAISRFRLSTSSRALVAAVVAESVLAVSSRS